MDREAWRNVFRGTIVTIPTPFDDDLRVDLGRMAELTQWLVEQGVGTNTAPLKVAAAMGEGLYLGDDEWPPLLRTVVNAASSDRPVICALKPKDTMHTIEDARRAQDLGAVGLQIDLPFLSKPGQDMNVRFFSDISEAVNIGIMIYNTFWFGCESITGDTLLRLADAEHVVAVKWAVTEDQDYDDMRKFVHLLNVIDNANQPVRCHKNGGHGYISSTISAYPRHDLEIWQHLEARRYDEAQAQFDRVFTALEPWKATVGKVAGAIAGIKATGEAMGQRLGPPRPPGLPASEQELNELKVILREIGWPVPAN